MPTMTALPPGRHLIHESGWLASGLPFTRWRRYQLHCETCGAGGPKHPDRDVVIEASLLHARFPTVPAARLLADATRLLAHRRALSGGTLRS